MYTTLFDDPDRINTELDRYRAISSDDVRAFALEYLTREGAVTVTYVPRASEGAE
jgi:hypothetical protein